MWGCSTIKRLTVLSYLKDFVPLLLGGRYVGVFHSKEVDCPILPQRLCTFTTGWPLGRGVSQ